MTEPINEFQDILDAMDRNPALRDSLRRHILTEELLQMPVRLVRLEEDIAELKAGQARIEGRVTGIEGQVAGIKGHVDAIEGRVTGIEGQVAGIKGHVDAIEGRVTGIEGQVAKIGGDVSNMKGDDYESFVAEFARRNVWRELGILATVFSTQKQREKLTQLATESELQGRIPGHESDSLNRADLVLTIDNSQDYILAEISFTVQQRDVDRSMERAAILNKVTGGKVTPLAIGTAEAPGLEKGDVEVLLIQQYQEN